MEQSPEVPEVEAFAPGETLSDEELTELALAADPDAPLAIDAVPFELLHPTDQSALPQWYMPAVALRAGSSRQRTVMILIVALLVAIEFSGLCSAFGQLVVG